MSQETLIRLAQAGDETAREALVQENAGLIWAVARRFQGRGTELEDLYQLGCLGFLKAVEGFDAAFGTRFSTYAVPKIAGEIRRFLRDDGAGNRGCWKSARKPVFLPKTSPWRKPPPPPRNPSTGKPERTASVWNPC